MATGLCIPENVYGHNGHRNGSWTQKLWIRILENRIAENLIFPLVAIAARTELLNNFNLPIWKFNWVMAIL